MKTIKNLKMSFSLMLILGLNKKNIKNSNITHQFPAGTKQTKRSSTPVTDPLELFL
jgi:hypothetical protein